MTTRRIVLLLAVAVLLAAGAAQAFAYVHSSMLLYSNNVPCGLTGVPRLLQVTHMIGPSQCKPPNKNTGKCDNAACNLSQPPSGESGKKGHCELVSGACLCVAYK